MDPQTDLWGNTIHQDLGGNSYIHDGYGQRQYLDQPAYDPPSSNSGSSGGGWSGDSGGGDDRGGGGEGSSGGGSTGGGGSRGSNAGAGCASIFVLGLLGMCVCSGVGNGLNPRHPTVNVPVKKPLPISTPRKNPSTETPPITSADKSSATSTAKTSGHSPIARPSSTPVVSLDQVWHGKLQLVERHHRTGAIKNSSKWTDIRLTLERTGDNVSGEVHFLEVGVTARVSGRMTDPSLTLVIDRVTSGPAAAVIVPCVLSGQPDPKRVFRGHWNAGVAAKHASTNPRFWLSEGEP